MGLEITALTKAHDRNGFSCSDEDVDLFLKQKAMQDQKLDLSRTYVLSDSAQERNSIVGYFTITPIHIRQEEMLNDKPKIKREIPALLLGQLGVDTRFQRKGMGELLLLNAESKALMASDLIGLRAIILDARNEDFVKWYAGYGYSRIGNGLRMAKNIELVRRELSFSG